VLTFANVLPFQAGKESSPFNLDRKVSPAAISAPEELGQAMRTTEFPAILGSVPPQNPLFLRGAGRGKEKQAKAIGPPAAVGI
jgi:hypothetical protein